MVRIHNPHKSSKVLEMILLLIGDPIVEGPVNMIPKLWSSNWYPHLVKSGWKDPGPLDATKTW